MTVNQHTGVWTAPHSIYLQRPQKGHRAKLGAFAGCTEIRKKRNFFPQKEPYFSRKNLTFHKKGNAQSGCTGWMYRHKKKPYFQEKSPVSPRRVLLSTKRALRKLGCVCYIYRNTRKSSTFHRKFSVFLKRALYSTKRSLFPTNEPYFPQKGHCTKLGEFATSIEMHKRALLWKRKK